MAAKLKPGSSELEVAFIDWLRANGYTPDDGIDPFLERSEFVREQRMLIHESELDTRIREARLHLKQRSGDPVFSGQFPMVYRCTGHDDQDMRYTVTVTLSDEGAEWEGRVWKEGEYIGEVSGSGSGPQANYVELARMHIESQIKCPGVIKRRER